MRIAILSDIHANLIALEAALPLIRTLGCDSTVSIGDSIAIGPFPSETLSLMSAEGIYPLMGNHEEYLLHGFPTKRSGRNSLQEIEHQQWTRAQVPANLVTWVKSWKYDHLLGSGLNRLRLLHFAFDQEGILAKSSVHSDKDLVGLFGSDFNTVIFGHTHKDVDVRLKTHYVNPGSFGCSRDAIARFITVEADEIGYKIQRHEVDFDRQVVLGALESRSVPARDEICRIFFGIGTE